MTPPSDGSAKIEAKLVSAQNWRTVVGRTRKNTHNSFCKMENRKSAARYGRLKRDIAIRIATPISMASARKKSNGFQAVSDRSHTK